MEDLKVKIVNSFQLYKLLKEPEFSFVEKAGYPLSVRRLVLRGVFGEPIITPAGDKKKSLYIDLRSAYGHYFSSYISKEDFVEVVNRWAS